MKAREPVEIPLSADALSVLRDLRPKAESLLVFPTVPQGPGVARALASAAKAAGISGPVGFHALRRSGATILRQQGVPLEVVMALGAWRSPEVLLKHYRKVTPEEVQKATRILDSAAHSKSQGRTQES